MLLNPPVYKIESPYFAAFLFFLFMLGRYNIDVGFALKPYMMFLFLFLFLHLASFTVQKLYPYEIALLLFYFYYSLTGAFSQYSAASLRIVLGTSLVLCCYFILRFILLACTAEQIERAIRISGLAFNAVSLLLYLAGLQAIGFQTNGDSIVSHGVLLDREYPRLIGLLGDPNFYIFYNTVFFMYFFTNLQSGVNKLGFVLSLSTIILTLSRGGILALLVVFLFYLIVKNPLKQWKVIALVGTFFAAGSAAAAFVFQLNIAELLQNRINDFSNDGGSGRFELWEQAWRYFELHPFLGIGAGNNLPYNEFFHGESLYAHNTYLQFLSEAGMIGFLLYLLFLALVFKQLMNKKLFQTKPYLILSFFAFLLQLVSLSIIIDEVFMLYLALLACSLQERSAHNERFAADR